MNRGIKVLLGIAIILVTTLTGCNKSKEDVIKNKVDIKEEQVENIAREEFQGDSNYQILEVVKKDNDLFVHLQYEVKDSNEAYKLGQFIVDSIEVVNKEKLKEDNIKNINVFFNGFEKDMLFDGTNIIKEVSQNWGGANIE